MDGELCLRGWFFVVFVIFSFRGIGDIKFFLFGNWLRRFVECGVRCYIVFGFRFWVYIYDRVLW